MCFVLVVLFFYYLPLRLFSAIGYVMLLCYSYFDFVHKTADVSFGFLFSLFDLLFWFLCFTTVGDHRICMRICMDYSIHRMNPREEDRLVVVHPRDEIFLLGST